MGTIMAGGSKGRHPRPPCGGHRAGHNGGVAKYEPTAEDRARIAARYPKRTLQDALIGIGGAVALLVAVVLVAISGVIRSNPPVAAGVRAFDASVERTTVDITVQRADPSQKVTCFLFAQAANHERVGEMDLEVGPGTDELTLVHVTVRTVREATSVTLENCRIVE